jgi:hypothetical protein
VIPFSSSSPWRSLRALWQGQGPRYVGRTLARYAFLELWRARPAVRRLRFRFAGREYPLLLARYRATWVTERAVELPLALAALAATPAADVLEIGNVLGHYIRSPHRVVDKYERAPGVENVDVLTLDPAPRYRLVVTVSTLEHVGWDETPREPDKAERAVHHLMRCLAPGGILLFTVAMGWHPPLEEALLANRPGLTRVACLVRTGDLAWEEVPLATVGARPYGRPFPCANAVLIGTYQAPDP